MTAADEAKGRPKLERSANRWRLVLSSLAPAALIFLLLMMVGGLVRSDFPWDSTPAKPAPTINQQEAQSLCATATDALRAGQVAAAAQIEQRLRSLAERNPDLESSCLRRLSAAFDDDAPATNPLIDLPETAQDVLRPLARALALGLILVLFGRILFVPAGLSRRVWHRGMTSQKDRITREYSQVCDRIRDAIGKARYAEGRLQDLDDGDKAVEEAQSDLEATSRMVIEAGSAVEAAEADLNSAKNAVEAAVAEVASSERALNLADQEVVVPQDAAIAASTDFARAQEAANKAETAHKAAKALKEKSDAVVTAMQASVEAAESAEAADSFTGAAADRVAAAWQRWIAIYHARGFSRLERSVEKAEYGPSESEPTNEATLASGEDAPADAPVERTELKNSLVQATEKREESKRVLEEAETALEEAETALEEAERALEDARGPLKKAQEQCIEAEDALNDAQEGHKEATNAVARAQDELRKAKTARTEAQERRDQEFGKLHDARRYRRVLASASDRSLSDCAEAVGKLRKAQRSLVRAKGSWIGDNEAHDEYRSGLRELGAERSELQGVREAIQLADKELASLPYSPSRIRDPVNYRLMTAFRSRPARACAAILVISASLVYVVTLMDGWSLYAENAGGIDWVATLKAAAGWAMLAASLLWLVLATHTRFPQIRIEKIEAGEGGDEISAAIAGSIRSLAAEDRGGIDMIDAPSESIKVPEGVTAAGGSSSIFGAIAAAIAALFSDIPYRVRGSWFKGREGQQALEVTVSRGWSLVGSRVFEAEGFGYSLEPRDPIRKSPESTSVLAAVSAPWILDGIQFAFHGDRLRMYGVTNPTSVSLEQAGNSWHETDSEIARSLYAEAISVDGMNTGATRNLAFTHIRHNRNAMAMALLSASVTKGDVSLAKANRSTSYLDEADLRELDLRELLPRAKSAYNYCAAFAHAGILRQTIPALPTNLGKEHMVALLSATLKVVDDRTELRSPGEEEPAGLWTLKGALAQLVTDFATVDSPLSSPSPDSWRKVSTDAKATRRAAYNTACERIAEPSVSVALLLLRFLGQWKKPKERVILGGAWLKGNREQLAELAPALDQLAYAARDPVLRRWMQTDPSLLNLSAEPVGVALTALAESTTAPRMTKEVAALWHIAFGAAPSAGPSKLELQGELALSHIRQSRPGGRDP